MKTLVLGDITVRQIEEGQSDYRVADGADHQIGMVEKTLFGSWRAFSCPANNARQALGTHSGSLTKTVQRFFGEHV